MQPDLILNITALIFITFFLVFAVQQRINKHR